MGLLEDCEVYFGVNDLYDVLRVPRNASDTQLKKAYRKVSLLCHPDKVDDGKKEEATLKFQTLSKVYSVLSDKENRAVYDETGCVNEENSDFEQKNWTTYWRLIFPQITVTDIENYLKKYRGSKEELEDLKKYYLQCEGDMNKMCEYFIGYRADDEEKYQVILNELIEKNEVPDFPKFSQETKARIEARKRKFKKEENELKKAAEDDTLAMALRNRAASREQNFDDMIKNLEAKYCTKSKKKSKK